MNEIKLTEMSDFPCHDEHVFANGDNALDVALKAMSYLITKAREEGDQKGWSRCAEYFTKEIETLYHALWNVVKTMKTAPHNMEMVVSRLEKFLRGETLTEDQMKIILGEDYKCGS